MQVMPFYVTTLSFAFVDAKLFTISIPKQWGIARWLSVPHVILPAICSGLRPEPANALKINRLKLVLAACRCLGPQVVILPARETKDGAAAKTKVIGSRGSPGLADNFIACPSTLWALSQGQRGCKSEWLVEKARTKSRKQK